ncbi:phosphoenolpyruvate carboxykinase [Syntrophus aciditrophicus]|uniref:Phosphoenolpyruvate carboxykinase (ATP) n=1 Tax=Syntrophus aciditrophicus (strain SB) TaxID=56780 RepID=Q2LY53_SYNAS|nr:phosphoenolpyruvate carboxykinase [Syntrophus aciditrophicus]ABC79013.1 phosphoenolpyruvate carboxykinase (ATP) [Syntrophus aciditrophicus SB]OPY17982.1 MAG: Phosphoenolpyruvate carboxykinase (ATP) [Syntrophus sp. PtaB.Bin075]
MNIFKAAAKQLYETARQEGRLIEGRPLEELKEIALRQEGVIQTHIGSVAADSEPMSRSAPHTRNSVDHPFGDEEAQLADQMVESLKKERLISLDTYIGDGRDGVSARFLVPEQYAQIAYGLKLLFNHPPLVLDNPTYTIIYYTDEAFERNRAKKLVDKDISIRLMLGDKRGDQVKICRNTIYLGEGKKGIFQFEDWRIKAIDKTGIFLHAGARRDSLWVYDQETARMELTDIVTAVAGLTATGKTTTLCRKFTKVPLERSEMIGDDGGALGLDASYAAFEMGGVYVKTEGLDASQPEILRAAESRDAFLENVALTQYPYMPNFADISKTGNGRAVVSRDNLEIASKSLRADRIHYIIILTRNPLVNVLSRLTPEQATMQFIYGESIESSGGNPEEAGRFKREFFLDPFMAGDRLEHAMIFYDIVKRNKIQCYLANTGTIGLKEEKVTLRQSLAAYNDLVRMQLRFSLEADHLGYHYPIKCDRANLDLMTAYRLFDDPVILEKRLQDFYRGRREYLEEFEGRYGRIPEPIRESLPYHYKEFSPREALDIE